MNDDKIEALLAYGIALQTFLVQVTSGFNLLELPSELLGAIKLVADAAVTVADAPAALAQYIALSDAGAADLEAWLVAQYGSNPSTVEQDIEKVLNFLINIRAVPAWILAKVDPSLVPAQAVGK
jgi:hypothetical protein